MSWNHGSIDLGVSRFSSCLRFTLAEEVATTVTRKKYTSSAVDDKEAVILSWKMFHGRSTISPMSETPLSDERLQCLLMGASRETLGPM